MTWGPIVVGVDASSAAVRAAAVAERLARDAAVSCELVHAVDSDSTARRLTVPWLLEVNLSGEPTKAGVPPADVASWVARYPGLAGLMTMPPLTADPEASRPAFRALRALADEHGLMLVSAGTSQDWRVAVQEGVTHVRIGAALYAEDSG